MTPNYSEMTKGDRKYCATLAGLEATRNDILADYCPQDANHYRAIADMHRARLVAIGEVS